MTPQALIALQALVEKWREPLGTPWDVRYNTVWQQGERAARKQCADELAAALGDAPQKEHEDIFTRVASPLSLPPTGSTASPDTKGSAHGPTLQEVYRYLEANDRGYPQLRRAMSSVIAQRDDLLKALKLVESVYRQNCVAPGEPSSVLDAMQAAIKKAESADAVARGAGEGQSRPRAHEGLSSLDVRDAPQQDTTTRPSPAATPPDSPARPAR